jgi:hypothetical protein
MKHLSAVAVAVALVTCGCAGVAPPSPSGTASAGPSATLSPSANPSAGTGLYMRAWQTQALPPGSNFTGAPFLTVADGLLIDGNVAVPAIFPGPLLILPIARRITPAGEQTIVDEANEVGLLGNMTDFTGGTIAPGGATGHLLLIVAGTRHELTGDPSRVTMCNDRPCPVDPGTPEAFGAFWWLLGNSDAWLGANLGPSATYQPQRLAVLVTAPATDSSGIGTNNQKWPLADFSSFGEPFAGSSDERCGVVEASDLAKLLPALQAGNQLTVFTDSTGAKQSVQPRPLVPLEDDPCRPAS